MSLLLSFSLSTYAKHGDKNDMGHQLRDTLILNDGNRFVIGEQLKLGRGSGNNNSFIYIYLSPTNWVNVASGNPNNTDRSLPATWANNEMQIKDFKLNGTKKQGFKWYVVLGGGNIANYWCEIVQALDSGEVETPLTKEKSKAETTTVIQQAPSKAAELKALKELLDEGVLTQEEFETEKQKILNQ